MDSTPKTERSVKMDLTKATGENGSVLEPAAGIVLPSIKPSPAKANKMQGTGYGLLPAAGEMPAPFVARSGRETPPDPTSRPLQIQVVTFNMNGTSVTADEIPKKLLRPPSLLPSDLYVIATQESGPLSAWASAVQRVLEEEGDVKFVATETLWDISISVYRQAAIGVEVIHKESIATGIGNVLGNKGANGLGLLINSATRILFINSHFAAHDDKVAERNADYSRICSDLFWTKEKDVTAAYDVAIWAGDFNYRINSNRRAADLLIENGMWEVLRANDQLTLERKKGRTFKGFVEGDVSFPPTFKFDPGTDTYDSSSKMRVPSWTDRVLWKCNPRTHPGAVELLHYTSVAELKVSDHRPVVATLKVNQGQGSKQRDEGGAAGSPVKSAACTVQ